MFFDRARFDQLVQAGQRALKNDDMDTLRQTVGGLYAIKITSSSMEDSVDTVNILKG